MKKLINIGLCLVVAFSLSGCDVVKDAFAPKQQAEATQKPKTPVNVSIVGRGSITKELAYIGQIMPKESIAVISKVPGKVLETYANIGDRVQLGKLLFKLDEKDVYDQIKQIDASINQSETSIQTAENAVSTVTGGQYEASLLQLETNIENAQKQVENAQVSLNSAQIAVDNALLQLNSVEYQINNYNLQLETAELQLKNAGIQVDNANLQYDNAKEIYDNVKKLYEGGVATKSEFDKAELAVNQLSAAMEQAQNTYEQARVAVDQINLAIEQTSVTQEQASLGYEQAKLTYEQASLAISQAKTAKDKAEESLLLTKGRITDDNIRTAEQSVNQAKAAKQILETQRDVALSSLKDMSVYAPMAGVISAKNVRVGEFVSSQAPAYTIVQVDKVNVEVKVSELLINKLNIGDLVRVSVRAVPDREFYGKIVTINPTADQSSTFPIKLELDNEDNALKPGMFAEIRFINEESLHTIVLPRNTVLETQSDRFVFVEENGVAVKVPVQTGIDNGAFIEIKSGLSEGARVIVKGMEYVADGDLLLVRNEVPLEVR